MLNKKMYELGSNRSAIRDLFEYGKTLAEKIGKENVFDYTLGNPSVPCPDEVNNYICELVKSDAVSTHGYTSAQGDLATRVAIVNYNKSRYGFELNPNLIYMTCGAAAALTIVLRAIISSANEEVIALRLSFLNIRYLLKTRAVNLLLFLPTKLILKLTLLRLKRLLTLTFKRLL